jgi:membrane dipeptidase
MNSRRRLLQAAIAGIAGGPLFAFGQPRVPIADMHSHYGMITKKGIEAGFGDDLRKSGVALVAWKLIADLGFTRSTSSGIEQKSSPEAGDLARNFERRFAAMKSYLAQQNLKTALTRADVEAAGGGEPRVVLAAEGADFLEGKLDGLDGAYAEGLRHLQLVHYIRTPVGDRQTDKPTHDGLSDMGKKLVEACNARGILVDLAHAAPAALDQALEIATAPLIWSHGWVAGEDGRWQDSNGFLQRRLSLAHAKKIADRGGVVGLWALGVNRASAGWNASPGNPVSYARELKSLVDKLGADHVAIGTDIEGVGNNAAIDTYSQLRTAVDALSGLGLDSAAVEKVAYANYARVLKAALKS